MIVQLLRARLRTMFSPARLVDAVVVGVAQQNVFGGVEQPRRTLPDRMLLVVVDPVAREIDVVICVVKKQRQICGELPGRIDHEVDDPVIPVLQQFTKIGPLFRIALDVVHPRKRLARRVKRYRVNQKPFLRENGNKILPHGAGCAEYEKFFPDRFMSHLLFCND